ncbi:complement C1q-like protein 3 [Ruditapes philippinarum]|uniref:complement C1q-like protein 3 n=1 Tax=Ruditapes philippinarum TaxID=129788 RepID=UPI00295BCD5E|nr:complement C1q-like protein 3 [Ruditapes philippinarum]
MDFIYLSSFFSAILIVCSAFQNVPQTSGYPSQLLANMMNDLKKAYDAKLSNIQTNFNKRMAQQEQRYNQLLDILRGEPREKRLLDGLVQSTASSPTKVAFYVQLSHDLSGLGNYQAIVFDLVTTNIGSGYNNVNGMFTAPSSGTYVFSWTSASADNHHIQTELVVNSKIVGTTWSDSGNHADYAIASNTVVVDLKPGDVVWIRSNTIHWHTIHGQRMTTFSGWLLYSQ